MKNIYDQLGADFSRKTTEAYSTSFSWAVKTLPQPTRQAIFDIYAYVRFADEIVDSFHDFNRTELLAEFREDTFKAIARGISMNPVINRFQAVVNEYGIDHACIEAFLDSMQMDLEGKIYTQDLFETYVLGSAEVVGLMCLSVFVNGDQKQYQELKAGAMKLGSVFQKINFLRDIKQDYEELGRTYFPSIEKEGWNCQVKAKIEAEIELEFKEARESILKLPKDISKAVMLAYNYYYQLFRKIKKVHSGVLMEKRVRINNGVKGILFLKLFLRHSIS
ncbi:MAG: phytoene synthase [Sphingobacteriales bacterium]|jgi:phytoene synthase